MAKVDDGEGMESPKAAFAAYRARWTPLVAAMKELEAEVLEAEVLFGPRVKVQFEIMDFHVITLWLATTTHIDWLELSEHERASSRVARTPPGALCDPPWPD